MTLETGKNPILGPHHRIALSRLDQYLQTPKQRVLREHQIGVNDLLQNRFKQAGTLETAEIIDQIVVDTVSKNPGIGTLEFYRTLANQLPQTVSHEKQLQSLQAIAGIDSNAARAGKKVLLFLNLKSVLTAIEPLLAQYPDDGDDLIQAAVTNFNKNIPKLTPDDPITTYIHHYAQRGTAEYLAADKNIPLTWILDNQDQILDEAFDELLEETAKPTGEQLESLAMNLSAQTGLSENQVSNYLNYKLWLKTSPEEEEEPDVFDSVVDEQLTDMISQAVDRLREDRKEVIIERFGLKNYQEHTLDEIAEVRGVTREWIRQIEARAMRGLRHLDTSKQLRPFIDFKETHGIRWPWPVSTESPLDWLLEPEYLSSEKEYVVTGGGYRVKPSRLKDRYLGFPLDKVISDTPLANALHWAGGIKDVAQLLSKTNEQLLAIKGVDSEVLVYVRTAIDRFLERDAKVKTIADLLREGLDLDTIFGGPPGSVNDDSW